MTFILLDLAKAQKVNLEEISITKLVINFMIIYLVRKCKSGDSIRVFVNGNLVTYLKLLLPGSPEEEFKGKRSLKN